MNYRHAFHAGNFADVFKHVLLTRILLYLLHKDAPVRYIDTHAGSGLYDLAGISAERTGEWRGGIGRLGGDVPSDVAALIDPYLALVGPRDAEGRPALYPGSPIIARRLLRPADRLTLSELHPQEARALRAAVGRDPRVRIVEIDGYVGLGAFVPPKERRGLVLIDPPYEASDEIFPLQQALARAYGKWPTGVYAVWYPVKEPDIAAQLARRLAGGLRRVLRLELLIDREPKRGAHDALQLIGCGLMVVNPPYVLESEARTVLPYLARRLSRDGGGDSHIEWLAGE